MCVSLSRLRFFGHQRSHLERDSLQRPCQMLSRIFQPSKGHSSAVFIGRTSAHFSKVLQKIVLIRKMYQIFFFAVVMLDLTANLGQFWMLSLDHPIIPSVFVSYLRKKPQKKMRREKKSFLALAVRKLPPSSSKNCFSTWSFGMAPLYTFTINHIVRNFYYEKIETWSWEGEEEGLVLLFI